MAPDVDSLPFLKLGVDAKLRRPSAPREDAGTMTLGEHLEDLRRVLMVSLGAWAATSLVGVIASGFVLDALILPLDYLREKLHYFSPMGYFSIHLKVGLVVGLALALPVILWQVWTFVSPGLKTTERRFAKPLLVSSLALFSAGAALAYFFLYVAIRMVGFVSHDTNLVFFPEANAYISFVLVLMVAFGITFEFPVALVLLSMARLVDSDRLRRWRKGAFFAIAAVGYIVTPGFDPVTPIALVAPLVLLYEAAILVIRRLEASRPTRERAAVQHG